jgi:hypothetical protein
VKKWFVRLTTWVCKKHDGFFVSNLGVGGSACERPKFSREASGSTWPLKELYWTREEAELAWKAKRTETNLALILPENALSAPCCSGGFLVDGIPATVTVCRGESVKQQFLNPTKQHESDGEQHERRNWVKFPPDPKQIEGRTCRLCGGTLVLLILNYFRDEITDVITPADQVEKCLSCGISFEIEAQ